MQFDHLSSLGIFTDNVSFEDVLQTQELFSPTGTGIPQDQNSEPSASANSQVGLVDGVTFGTPDVECASSIRRQRSTRSDSYLLLEQQATLEDYHQPSRVSVVERLQQGSLLCVHSECSGLAFKTQGELR